MNKVAVITGSNGFVGKNLAGYLIQQGYKVAGFPRELFTDPPAMTAWLKEANPNLIVHLSAYGNHVDQKDIADTVLANVVNTYSLLMATKDIDYDAFINVSTSSVYGNSEMKETSVLNTDTFYGCTKVAGEYLSRAFAIQEGKPIVTVRPFSVYGPGEADHRFIPKAIKAIVFREPFELYPDPVHDWVYVEDFIDGVLVAAKNVKKLKGTAVNIGTGRQYTNEQVYDQLVQVIGKSTSVRKTRGKARDYEPNKWASNMSSLKLFDWRPKVELDIGLMLTWEYYKFKYIANKSVTLREYIEATTTYEE